MLLEFVEHHLHTHKVDHIFLGFALDWNSAALRKHLLLLGKHIREGRVSVSSLALSGYDDAMGFSGMRLNEE